MLTNRYYPTMIRPGMQGDAWMLAQANFRGGSCVIFLLLVNQFHVLFFSGEQFEKVTKNRRFVLLKIASFA